MRGSPDGTVGTSGEPLLRGGRDLEDLPPIIVYCVTTFQRGIRRLAQQRGTGRQRTPAIRWSVRCFTSYSNITQEQSNIVDRNRYTGTVHTTGRTRSYVQPPVVCLRCGYVRFGGERGRSDSVVIYCREFLVFSRKFRDRPRRVRHDKEFDACVKSTTLCGEDDVEETAAKPR